MTRRHRAQEAPRLRLEVKSGSGECKLKFQWWGRGEDKELESLMQQYHPPVPTK